MIVTMAGGVQMLIGFRPIPCVLLYRAIAVIVWSQFLGKS